MVFKKGKTKDLFGCETPAYLVVVEGTVIARIFKWSVFYPKKIHNVFLKTFSRKGQINYVAIITDANKKKYSMIEAEKMTDLKKWIKENWNGFKFRNTTTLSYPRLIYIPEIRFDS